MFWNKTAKVDNTKNKTQGLFASLEDLIAQKKYLPYIKKQHNYITSNQAGDIRSAFKGRGMEFEEVRVYGFGDDVRDIDWRVTARKNQTYTKVFAEEKDREVYVILDLSPYMLFGTKKELKSVAAAKLAALLGWQSIVNKDRFGLVIYDGITTKVFKPQNNQKNLMTVFKAISDATQKALSVAKQSNATGNITQAIDFLRYNIKSHAMVFVLSDFKSFTSKKELVALTKHCRVYCLNIYDIVEEVPPQSGEYMSEYQGEDIIFNSASDNFKRAYYQYFQNKRQEMEQFCKKFGCQYVNIRTDKPLYKQLKIL